MRLIRCGAPALERPGVLLPDGTRLDVSAAVRDYDEEFLGGDGMARLRELVRQSADALPRFPDAARLGPPVCRPSKIVCIGLNFVDHARETRAQIPKEPVLFFKSTTALQGPEDDVTIPRGATKVDYEVELAFVVGRLARHVPEERALEHVAGLVLHNDYSERAFQLERGGQWVKGKSCDTFAPLGPALVTLDQVPDPGRLRMWLKVNGETRQESSTANMVFGVAHLLSYVSTFMTLLPGDVISTGTPAGVGLGFDPPRYLKAGDVVELGIEHLGQQRQRLVPFHG